MTRRKQMLISLSNLKKDFYKQLSVVEIYSMKHYQASRLP